MKSKKTTERNNIIQREAYSPTIVPRRSSGLSARNTVSNAHVNDVEFVSIQDGLNTFEINNLGQERYDDIKSRWVEQVTNNKYQFQSSTNMNKRLITKASNLHDRTVIKLLGLNMEAVCSKVGHEKNKIMFICKNEWCQAQNRFCCAHCFLQEHSDHPKDRLGLQDYCSAIDKHITEFKQIISEISQVEPMQQELIGQIREQFSNFQNDVILQLESLEAFVVQAVKEQITHQDSWSSIDKEIDQLSRKNIFDLTPQEQKYSIDLLNGKQLESLRQLHRDLKSEFSQQESHIKSSIQTYNTYLQQDVFQAIKDNLCQSFNKIDSTEEARKRLQVLDDRKRRLDNDILKLQEILIQAANVEQQRQNKCQDAEKKIIKQRSVEERIRRAFDIEKKEMEKQKTEKLIYEAMKRTFPYQIYESSCSHTTIAHNTIPIWSCCNSAFPCIICHGTTQHQPYLSNPSMRYCIKCLEISWVKYPTNQIINCMKCIKP